MKFKLINNYFVLSKFHNGKSPITFGEWDWPSTKLDELHFVSSLLIFCCLENQTAAFKEPARLMTQLIKQCVATKMMFIKEHSGVFCYWSQQAVGKWLTMLILPRVSGNIARAELASLSRWLISFDASSEQNGRKTSEKYIRNMGISKQSAVIILTFCLL